MSSLTASLERSLQNCSLNSGGGGETSSSSSENQTTVNSGDTTVELNSHLSLPYHWEQCLDLKTGEIYYINWSNGMKAREDPRTVADNFGDFCYEEEEVEDVDGDSDSDYDDSEGSTTTSDEFSRPEHVLVVAGCKSCFMYYMVPKQDGECPKCSGQLLHFDGSQIRS